MVIGLLLDVLMVMFVWTMLVFVLRRLYCLLVIVRGAGLLFLFIIVLVVIHRRRFNRLVTLVLV